MLLLAALDLENAEKKPFSAEDLVVKAWQLFPNSFGLAGYQDDKGNLIYPDSNRVFVEIMGQKPIRKKGLIEKVGMKMYQLTESGRQIAEALKNERSGDKGEVKTKLSREAQNELKRLFKTKAFIKFKENRVEDITFHDACSFWSISPRSTSVELMGKIANLERLLAGAIEESKESAIFFRHGSEIFTMMDFRNLLCLHQEMLKKFRVELNIIKDRTNERI